MARTAIKNQAEYNKHLDRIRKLRNQGAEYETEAMFAILEFEKLNILWKRSKRDTFEAVVLEREKLCPVGRYRAFKKAANSSLKKYVKKLGVDSACLLAKQPGKSWFRLVGRVLDFRKRHAVEPTYQFLTREVMKIHRRKGPKPPSRGTLLKYIALLKSTIEDLGGKAPSMEE